MEMERERERERERDEDGPGRLVLCMQTKKKRKTKKKKEEPARTIICHRHPHAAAIPGIFFSALVFLVSVSADGRRRRRPSRGWETSLEQVSVSFVI